MLDELSLLRHTASRFLYVRDTWRSEVAQSSSWSENIKRLAQLQPAVVRGLLVAVTGIMAQVVGYTVVGDDTIGTILDAYTSVSALVSAFWIRGSVTPHVKVVAYKPDPFASNEVASGPADGIAQALAHLDDTGVDDVNVEVPPILDPSLIQQEDIDPVQTDNSSRYEDGDQSIVSQAPVLDTDDE